MKIKSFSLFLMVLAFILTACEPGYQPTQIPEKPRKPTQAPPDTNSPDPQVDEFSLDRADQVPPSDVLQEVAYYPSGGIEPCEPTEQPLAQSYPTQLEVLQRGEILTCGWSDGESIMVTVFYPDGSKFPLPRNATSGALLYSFVPYDPGQHTIVFEGSNYRIELEVTAYYPRSPRMYKVGQNIGLYGLATNENVALFAYQLDVQNGVLSFAGWDTYQADSTGLLFMNISDKSLIYYTYGETSGLLQDGNSNVMAKTIFK